MYNYSNHIRVNFSSIPSDICRDQATTVRIFFIVESLIKYTRTFTDRFENEKTYCHQLFILPLHNRMSRPSRYLNCLSLFNIRTTLNCFHNIINGFWTTITLKFIIFTRTFLSPNNSYKQYEHIILFQSLK
jgi:hypothetical protein